MRFNPSLSGVLLEWQPDIARPRPDQPAARILLLRMRDPADGAPQGKESKDGARPELEVPRQHTERPIDIRQPAGRRRYGCGNAPRRCDRAALRFLEEIEQQTGARIALGIERMPQARRRLASLQAAWRHAREVRHREDGFEKSA